VNIELPEEYADWVKHAKADGKLYDPPRGTGYVRVDVGVFDEDRNGQHIAVYYFVPPKPKPTLPEVKLGGVLRYMDKAGRTCRAMQFAAGKWRVYTFAGEIVVGAPGEYWHDGDLIAHANGDGFTVELEGL
jgi:hypothetical protein